MKSVLVIGPRFKPGRKVGGAVVLFENLLLELERNDVKCYVVDTYKSFGFLRSYLYIFRSIFSNMKRHEVVWLNSSRDYVFILPYLMLLNLFFKKEIYLRKFGGELVTLSKVWYYSLFFRIFFPPLNGAFFESKELCSLFLKFNTNTYWFPNVREPFGQIPSFTSIKYNRRFVFFGQIKVEKGVGILTEAFSQLDSSYSLDLYGTLEDPELIRKDLPINVTYKGLLAPHEVRDVLFCYDVVVLPTFYPGEGYPGIIIEAYSCGKPVIATLWGQIPELVNNFQTGILVHPGSVSSLLSAVAYFNGRNYNTMAVNAFHNFKDFESGPVTSRIIKKIFH